MDKKILIPSLLFPFVFFVYFTNSNAHTKVHDNYLYFTHDAHSVSFIAKSHCITSGQPYQTPDESQAQQPSKGVGIDIKAGRHASKKTEHCLSKMFGNTKMDKKFTFDSRPTELNFATEGTLTIDGETFDQIVLAQGRSGANNNWWFGGVNCLNPLFDADNKDQVNCTATDGTKWCFTRGATSEIIASNSGDHVKVEKHPCADPDK